MYFVSVYLFWYKSSEDRLFLIVNIYLQDFIIKNSSADQFIFLEWNISLIEFEWKIFNAPILVMHSHPVKVSVLGIFTIN